MVMKRFWIKFGRYKRGRSCPIGHNENRSFIITLVDIAVVKWNPFLNPIDM